MPRRFPFLALLLLSAAGCSGQKPRAGEKAVCDGIAIFPAEVTLRPRETATFVVSTVDGPARGVDLDWKLEPARGTVTAEGGFIAPPQLGDILITVTYWRLPDDTGSYLRTSNGKRYTAACYASAMTHIVAENDGGIDAGDASSDADAEVSDSAIDGADGSDASDAFDGADAVDAPSDG